MYIPADVILVWLALGLGWLACRDKEPDTPPPAPRAVPHEESDFSTEPPPEVEWLRTYQIIAQARGDWKMSDHYRDKANRLVAAHEADRQAYNRALRTRILGADRAKDYESTWRGNPHGEELS